MDWEEGVMKKCWRCAEDIQEEALICRFCHTGQSNFDRADVAANRRTRPRQVRSWSLGQFLGCVFGLMLFIGIIAAQNSPALPTRPIALAGVGMSPNPDRPTVKVTAAELVRAYDANELGAQEKYGASALEVTGKMRSVNLDMSDEPILHFAVPGTLVGVSAHFASNSADGLGSIQTGDSVTVNCAKISELMGVPIVKDCFFVSKNPPSSR
jgi:hypothetical protein